VRQAMGGEFAERCRRIEAVFAGRASAATEDWWRQTPGRPPPLSSAAATAIDTQVLERPTPLSMPHVRADVAPPRPKLTSGQRLIIAAASTVTFVATVAIGMALLSGFSGGAKASRPPESAFGSGREPVSAPPTGPSNH